MFPGFNGDQMKVLKLRKRPEAAIQEKVINYLKIRDWFVRPLHGDAMNYGWPDLFASHNKFGPRWIEIKLPDMKGSHFTPAQLQYFPLLTAAGSGVWIMTSDSDSEYHKLFRPCNWYQYLSILR